MNRRPVLVLTGLLLATSSAIAQTAPPPPPPIIDAKPMKVTVKPNAVTVYLGRASITRSATLDLSPGVYDLQFGSLPDTVQPQSLQARATGNVKVLGVQYEQGQAASASSPELIELDGKIEQVQKSLKELNDQRDLIKSQEDFIAAITVKAAADASKEGGTKDLDLEVVRKQIAFISEERGKLMDKRRSLDDKQKDLEKQLKVVQDQRNAKASGANVSRTAIVSVVATEAGESTVELTYLVANATWEPTYNVRASADGSAALVEYDAMLTQRTGEDWDDVKMTLSTAQPAIAANPPAISPWFVDVRPKDDERPAREMLGRAMSKMEVASPAPADAALKPGFDEPGEKDKFAALAADAEVGGRGPSVTFQLPRAVTVMTNSQKQQTTRISTIDTSPRFVFVAIPALTDAVYMRGEMVNASSYQLLPGRASIFLDQDYIGPTALPSVAPGGEFKVFFGIDPAVKASRTMVAKNTGNTGLLSGGRKTTYEYRLTIDNGTGKSITVELWDRYPVSRNDQIQVELENLSDPLVADAVYVAQEKPQGLLKWWLNVPANASGKSSYVLTYGVHINRAKDVEMTPLPE